MKTLIGYFMDNINVNGSGAVMASPSKTNPNYYYHWMRDAAISMDVLQHIPNTTASLPVESLMNSYISWVHATRVFTLFSFNPSLYLY